MQKRADVIGVYSCVVDRSDLQYIDEMIAYLAENVSTLYVVCNEKQYEAMLDKNYGKSIVLCLGTYDHYENYRIGVSQEGTLISEEERQYILVNSDIIGPINSMDLFWENVAKESFSLLCAMPSFEGVTYLPYSFCALGTRASKELREYIATYTESFDIYAFKRYIECCQIEISYLYGNDDEKKASIWEYSKLLQKKTLPFVPIELLKKKYAEVINYSVGNCYIDLMDYLKLNCVHLMDVIWDYVLKTRSLTEIIKIFHLNYSVPTEIEVGKKTEKTAIVVHVYYPELIEEIIENCSSNLKSFDFYFSSDTDEKCQIIREKINGYEHQYVEVRKVENRGRDVSCLLVGMRDLADKYDYICFAHDKKTSYVGEYMEGRGFAEKCMANVLYNLTFCKNVIDLFEKNPRMGIAFPPEPNHASFFSVLGNEWSYDYDITVELAKQFGLEKYISFDEEPIAPLGTCFWFRSKALRDMFVPEWKYEDFPPEPNGIDGTILHAWERLYAYFGQAKGYYAAYIMTDKWGALEYTNLHYYTRCYNERMLKLGITGRPADVISGDIHSARLAQCEEQIEDLQCQNKKLREYVAYLENEVIPGMSIKNRVKRIFNKNLK